MRTFLLLAALAWHSAGAQPAAFGPLDVVANPLASFSVMATVDRDPTGNVIPGYRVGESLTITLSTDRDAYVYLFNVRADGTVALFFPNVHDPDHVLQADQPRILPGPGYTLDLEGPTGLDKVLAVASLEPLDLDGLLAATERGGFARADLNERTFASALTSVLERLDATSWAANTAAFYIAEASDVALPAFGVALVDSMPSGASVFIDDNFQGFTPLEVYGRPGSYSLRLEHEGYEPFVTAIDLDADERVEIEGLLQESPRIGRLELHFDVRGVTVHVDGHPYSAGVNTSITFADLLAGEYELTATAPGYHTRIEYVVVAGGSSSELVLELMPRLSDARPYGRDAR